MRVRLKGVYSVTMTLADGRRVTYRYAWRGGPRLHAEPGTDAFIAELAAARATLAKPQDDGTVRYLIAFYKTTSEFTAKREITRREYLRYLDMIGKEFGDMPIAALSDPKARGEFKEWRDTLADRPRTADLAWSVLARMFSVAKDRGKIAVNPCERGGRLYSANRTDAIWTHALIARAEHHFSERLRWALTLALWTGQRQGDLLRLPWGAYDGEYITMRQSKTGKPLRIPVGKPLKDMLDGMKRRQAVILTNADGDIWKPNGFRTAWARACDKAGIAGVTFHDLRGSAVTRLAEAGASVPEIATFTGHRLATVEAILDAHYLSRSNVLAISAVRKLEAKATGTDSVKCPPQND